MIPCQGVSSKKRPGATTGYPELELEMRKEEKTGLAGCKPQREGRSPPMTESLEGKEVNPLQTESPRCILNKWVLKRGTPSINEKK